LTNALRAESQEICFVGEGNYTDFIKSFAPEALKPGPIMDMKGKVIGSHNGIALYTIGQRKRLNISSLEPVYVADIDRKNHTVTVGAREDAMGKTFNVRDLNWISLNSISGPVRAGVKIRSTMKDEPSIITPERDGSVRVEFDEPQWAPASGQSAVFYNGDTVIGGGIIE